MGGTGHGDEVTGGIHNKLIAKVRAKRRRTEIRRKARR